MLVLGWNHMDALALCQSVDGYLIVNGYFSDQPMVNIKNRIEIPIDQQAFIATYRLAHTCILERANEVSKEMAELCEQTMGELSLLDTVYLTVPILLTKDVKSIAVANDHFKTILGSLSMSSNVAPYANHNKYSVFTNNAEVTVNDCTRCKLNSKKLNGICLYYVSKINCLINTLNPDILEPTLAERILASTNNHGTKVLTAEEANNGGGCYYV